MSSLNSESTVTIVDIQEKINKPQLDVWNFLIDPTNRLRWRSHYENGSVTIENGENNKLCLGAKCTLTDNHGKQVVHEVIKFEPMSSATSKCLGPYHKGSFTTWYLLPVERTDGSPSSETLVRFHLEISGSSVTRLYHKLSCVKNKLATRSFEKDLRKMKRLLEEGA
jgi:hypothetical protein